MPNVLLKFDMDTSEVQGRITGLKYQMEDVDQAIKKERQAIMNYWNYFNQIATMVNQFMQQAFEGTGAALAAQKVVAGIQITQQQIAIAQTIVQAKAAFAAGQVGQGVALLSIAGMMEGLFIQSKINQRRITVAQEQQEAYQESIEDWEDSYI
jgi:hypothetical protein